MGGRASGVSEQVAQMRREGLTQTEIARTLGVSQQTVSNDLRDVTNAGNALPETITDSLGRKQPAKKASLPPVGDARA